ncbi:MAG: YcbK family protein [Paracoccaceae bacterium]
MTADNSTSLTRRGVLKAFAATTLVAAPTYANAFGLIRGAGDIRRLKMHSGRTGERIDTIYWLEGEYIPEAMAEVNRFMRDWRNNQAIEFDRRTIDILAASHRMLDTDASYLLLSGYRSPQTNAMLRSRSRGVARNSLHMKGQATDIRLEGRSVSQIARAALSCSAGGVGKYSRSNFVHVDCGDVRSWGR